VNIEHFLEHFVQRAKTDLVGHVQVHAPAFQVVKMLIKVLVCKRYEVMTTPLA
jgi:hypothetical protein